MADAARLRITLLYLDPAPWREVDVPLSMTLAGLHDTIQAAFLWFNCHLWEFELSERRYGPFPEEGLEDERVYKASTTRLAKLKNMEGKSFFYTYDFGDNWLHKVDVVSLFDMKTGDRLPHFINGEGRTPPEDIGGPPGFEMFVDAMSDPDNEDHDHYMDWYGKPFDPNDIDEEILRIHMKRLANMRAPKK